MNWIGRLTIGVLGAGWLTFGCTTSSDGELADGDTSTQGGDDGDADAGVDDGAGDADASVGGDEDAGEGGDAGVNGGASSSSSSLQVQDMWVLRDLHAVMPDGKIVGLLDELTELALDEAAEAVQISETATFRPSEILASHMRLTTGEIRDDMAVTGGVIEDGDAVMVTFFATADPGAPLPGTDDIVAFTLPAIDGLEAGIPLMADYQFVQVLPNEDAEADADADDPIDVFAKRVMAGSFQYPAAGDDLDDLVFIGQAGEVLGPPVLPQLRPNTIRQAQDTGETGGLPAKSRPFFDKFFGGFGKCLTKAAGAGLKCVKEVMNGSKQGAKDWNDSFNGNLGGDPPPAPQAPAPKTPECFFGCGVLRDDPHLYTFDRKNYEFQMVGEFVAARSDEVEVQVRTAPAGNRTDVSWVTRAAVGVGGHVIEVPAGHKEPIFVDGELMDVRGAGSKPTALDDVQIWWMMSGVDIWYEDDSLVRVVRSGTHVNVFVQGRGYDQWEGLLGDNDGDREDGLTSRDGEVFEARGSEEFYSTFGHSWRVTDEESLFTYADGADTETFTDLDFPSRLITVGDLDPAARAQAEALCQGVGIFARPLLDECVLDYVLTGELSTIYGAQSMLAAQRASEVEDHSTLDGFVASDAVIFEGEPMVEDVGGALIVGEGLALVRTQRADDYALHAVDIGTGGVRWTVDNIDPRCQATIVEGMGVALQLDQSANEETGFPPIVLVSFDDGEELMRTPEPPNAACGNALSSVGSMVLQTTRTALYAYDAANGLEMVWTIEPNDVNWEFAPAVQGYFAVYGRELSVEDPMTITTLDPETGDEVDSMVVPGGDHRQLEVLGPDRLGVISNSSADGPVATAVLGVDEDGNLSEVWSVIFDDASEYAQPTRLAALGDVIVGWTNIEAGNGLIAFDANTGDIEWTYKPVSNDPSGGLVESVKFDSAVAYPLIGGLWIELLGPDGVPLGSIEESPDDNYSQPYQLNALPDGRFLVGGRYDGDETGTYLHFVKP